MPRRIQSWSNKFLSFGRRAQLKSSVLFGIQIYLSSIFILPCKIMKDIESMLSVFLWKGLELKSSEVKVAWPSVCLPKKEVGLSFKRIREWNGAAMLRRLRAICKKEDTLWVYVTKTQCIWSTKLPSDSSWTLRKNFGLRN